MLKITEIIVAKIKIFGQDHGWILTKFAKQKNEANIQPFWPSKFGVLNDENRQRGKYIQVSKFFSLSEWSFICVGYVSCVWFENIAKAMIVVQFPYNHTHPLLSTQTKLLFQKLFATCGDIYNTRLWYSWFSYYNLSPNRSIYSYLYCVFWWISVIEYLIHHFHTDHDASCFPISPGYYSRPKTNRRQWLCKILGGKQGALWPMWKWWIW